MGRFLLFTLIIGAGFSLLFAPWIAGLAYVLNSLLQPQYIWFWIFEGIPIFRITAGLAILGSIFALSQKKADSEIYRDRQNLIILIIWFWMHLSHLLSSFKGVPVSVSPELVLGNINSIFIMYFVLLPLLNSEKALKYLCYGFIFVGSYYVYWANSAYINQEWYRFSNGRLKGPHGSPYRDENALSTLIVMSLPFIILLFFRVKNTVFKGLILLSVPMAWHAIVLFSSRSALLASVVSLLLMASVIKSKKVNILIASSFVIFMVYQGSLLIGRTTETIESSRVETNEPINPRLISWEAGLRLIPEYPIFGAGVQMFEAATRYHFPGMTPHVAHNTFINFSANTGVLTGIMFLLLIYIPWRRLKEARKISGSFDNMYYYGVVASSISLISFFVCSIFLDLIIFEPFYIVLIINLIAWKGLQKRLKSTDGIDE
jgi:O-antigen ligase